jgi:F0F1-type ATP synthase membrane subunit b/b'
VLINEVAQEFIKIYQTAKETLNQKMAQTEQDIENYKRERLKELDKKIYQTIGEIAKEIIGKTIDLSTHEKLVIRALEKAKREIF